MKGLLCLITVILVFTSCNSRVSGRGILPETVYRVEEINIQETRNFVAVTDNILIRVSEGVPGGERISGVSGTDGSNFYHEVKNWSLEDILTLLLESYSENSYVFIGENNYESLNFYAESLFTREEEFHYETAMAELLNQMSLLFNFTMEEKELPNKVYIYSVEETGKAEKHFVKLNPLRYTSAAGLLSGSRTNYNEDKNEYYATFEDQLNNVSYKGNYPFVNNTGLKGVFALPLGDETPEEAFNSLQERCREWGIGVEIREEIRPTTVITYTNE